MEVIAPDRELRTQLLEPWSSGNKEGLDELMPAVYDQLRKRASNCLRSERPADTLPETALVHETSMRPVGVDLSCEERVQFCAVAARILRRILVDPARSQTGRSRRRIREDSPWMMPS